MGKLNLTPEEKTILREGTVGDVEFAIRAAFGDISTPSEDPHIQSIRNRIESEYLTPEQISEIQDELEARLRKEALRERFEHKRSKEQLEYLKAMGKSRKVGIGRVHEEGNALVIDEQYPVPFALYSLFSKADQREEILRRCRLAGTAVIVRTKDGKLVVQHRSDQNKSYGDIPGASAAGLFDGTLNRRDPGTLQRVGTGEVVRNAMLEAKQEIGVNYFGPEPSVDTESVKEFAAQKLESESGERDIADLKITGFARDRVKPHFEFMLFAQSRLDANEFLREARRAQKQEKKTGYDFAESFFFIEAAPQAIQSLLAKVKCPLPPTHAAAFVAAGYNMVLENQGVEQAEQWRTGMEQEIQRNWTEIDEIVKNYYLEHPEALERNAGANPNGYDADFLPEDQGLPSLNSELVRLHLESDIEKSIEEAFLFDIDGVITDPDEKRITQVELLDSIIRRLELGYPIGFNTGRAINWVSERVINPLRQRILERKKSLKMLSNIFLSGEYGGTWMEFDKKGNGYVYMNQNISIPLQFQEEIRRMIANKYLYAMFYDEDKKTMVSAEMNPGFNLEEFKEVQKEFYEDVKALIAANGLTNQIRVDNTTIATDIEDATAGKRLGTKKFLEWLRKKRIKPELFRVFGDSAADEEMAEELDINGRNAEYWFVGKELGKKERRFRVLTPQKNFSQLTCQALRELDPVA